MARKLLEFRTPISVFTWSRGRVVASATRIFAPCAWPGWNIQASIRDFFVQRGNKTAAAVVDVGVKTFRAASLEVCRLAATIVGPLNPFRAVQPLEVHGYEVQTE